MGLGEANLEQLDLKFSIGNSCKFETKTVKTIDGKIDQNLTCTIMQQYDSFIIETYDNSVHIRDDDKLAWESINIPKSVWNGQRVEVCSKLNRGDIAGWIIQVCLFFHLDLPDDIHQK